MLPVEAFYSLISVVKSDFDYDTELSEECLELLGLCIKHIISPMTDAVGPDCVPDVEELKSILGSRLTVAVLLQHAIQEAVKNVEWAEKNKEQVWARQQDFCNILDHLVKNKASNDGELPLSKEFRESITTFTTFVMSVGEYIATELLDFACSATVEKNDKFVTLEHVKDGIKKDNSLRVQFKSLVEGEPDVHIEDLAPPVILTSRPNHRDLKMEQSGVIPMEEETVKQKMQV
eukprot:Filipodium_phascolosomae@DN887_c0_g1_i1.p1